MRVGRQVRVTRLALKGPERRMRSGPFSAFNVTSFVLMGLAYPSVRMKGQSYQAVADEAVAAGVPGIQAYVKRGAIQWQGTAGVSSVEAARPTTLTDRLRVASITKMITYAAVQELVKAGRLTLSDRGVTVTAPGTLGAIPHADAITVAQLLDHKSGLYNFNGQDGSDFFSELFSDSRRGTAWSAAELLRYAKRPEHPPTHRPGERVAYSSTGYIVLETVLEHSTGRPFAEIFREYVFAPLGMTSAGVEGSDLGPTVSQTATPCPPVPIAVGRPPSVAVAR